MHTLLLTLCAYSSTHQAHKHTNTQTHTHTYTHKHSHTHTHTNTHTHTHALTSTHTHTNTHTHKHTHIAHALFPCSQGRYPVAVHCFSFHCAYQSTCHRLSFRTGKVFPVSFLAPLFTALTNSCATHCLFAQGRFSKWNSLPLFSLRLPIYVPQTVFPHREGFPSEIPCLSHCCAYQFTCNTDTLILTGRLPSIHLPALLSCPPIAHTLRVDQKLYMTLCTCVRI